MTDDSHKIAESIRSGRYFEDARAWYQAVYIGPISERTFFLIIATLAAATAFIAIISVFSLMPLVSRPAIIIPAQSSAEDVVPRLTNLREKRQNAQEAVAQFFVLQYVAAWERYSAEMLQENALFVHAQSDEATYNAYLAQYDASNPQSPTVKLGHEGSVDISVQAVRMNFKGDGGTAEVDFTSETSSGTTPEKTRWTATLKYRYTEMGIDMVDNAKTGAGETTFRDPKFQVVGYAVEKK